MKILLQGLPPTAASNARGYEKNPDFWPVFCVISKIVQDRAIISIADQCGLTSPYLAELCQPVVHLTGRRHLRSAASSKLDVQRTATAIGRTNFAVSGPETWNSLPAEQRLSTLSTATFARRLKAHLFVSTEWHVPAARLWPTSMYTLCLKKTGPLRLIWQLNRLTTFTHYFW